MAPIAPLNTTPVPMAAFNMAQSMPAQPLGMVGAGMVAPMPGIPSMVPSIGSMNTGRQHLVIVLAFVKILIFVFFFQVLELLRR